MAQRTAQRGFIFAIHPTHGLALSGEHTGFTFERDLAKAENMIRLHSGGENAVALRALRGGASGTLAGRGDARELLATTRGRPTDCAACATA